MKHYARRLLSYAGVLWDSRFCCILFVGSLNRQLIQLDGLGDSSSDDDNQDDDDDDDENDEANDDDAAEEEVRMHQSFLFVSNVSLPSVDVRLILLNCLFHSSPIVAGLA